MIIFVCGMPRSASTWSYNVCRKAVAAAGRKLHPLSGLYTQETLPPEEDLVTATDEVLLLMIHFLDAALLERIDNGQWRAVYTVRDPRDATVSLMRTFNTSFKNSARQIHRSLLMWEYMALNEIGTIVRYCKIRSLPERAVQQICQAMDLELDHERHVEIAESLSRERLRESVPRAGENGVTVSRGIVIDNVTLLTARHFAEAFESDWRGSLTRGQKDFTNWQWRKWIGALDPEKPERRPGVFSSLVRRLGLMLKLRLWRQAVY